MLQKDRYYQLNRLFYGGEDPLIIMRRIIADWKYQPYDILFLIGIGLGQLPIFPKTRDLAQPRMIIIEPSFRMFYDALYYGDLKPLLTNQRIELFVGEEINIAKIIEDYREIIPIGRNRIIVHPGYEQLNQTIAKEIKQELSERIRTLRSSWYTTKIDGRKMFSNTVDNLPSLFAGTPMKNLKNRFKGFTAFCIAAGPSLDNAISDLKRVGENALIIACDSAVNALAGEGIKPHVVATTDVFETNIQKLKPHFEAIKDAIFIFGIESNPDNVRLFLGTKRVAVSAYNKLLLDWIDPAFDLQCQYPDMSSVSHMAIFTAMAVGAEPIVLVGMDLAYQMGKSHSFHSAYFHLPDRKNIVQTIGTDGAMVPSSAQFVADKLLIENVVRETKMRIINTALKGAYIEGAEVKCMAEIIEEVNKKHKTSILEIKNNVVWGKVADEKKAFDIISLIIKKFSQFKKVCKEEREKIFDLIEQVKSIDNTLQQKSFMENALTEFEEFKRANFVCLQSIHDLILSDMSEIFKKREKFLAETDCVTVNDNIVVNHLKLIVEHLRVYEEGINYLIGKLKSYLDFTREILTVDECIDGGNNIKKIIKRASYYENCDELWQVQREYETYMKSEPGLISPYICLANTYMNEKLWKSASVLIENAICKFGDNPELVQLKRKIDKSIDNLFEEIKNEWMQGKINETRKLMNEYLILRPDDAQINELKRVIGDLDKEFSNDWCNNQNNRMKKLNANERIQKASEHIRDLKFEKGIGILEGIIEDYPESGRQLREQIGDIRKMKKDYESAYWNYSEALKEEPGNMEVLSKVNFVRSLL